MAPAGNAAQEFGGSASGGATLGCVDKRCRPAESDPGHQSETKWQVSELERAKARLVMFGTIWVPCMLLQNGIDIAQAGCSSKPACLDDQQCFATGCIWHHGQACAMCLPMVSPFKRWQTQLAATGND